MSPIRFYMSATVVLLMSGCALTPDYEPPEMDLPEAFVQPSDAGASIANVKWFEIFSDPVLVSHIEMALDQNRDRAVAMSRIAEASAIARIARGDQYPILDFDSQLGRAQVATDGTAGEVRSEGIETTIEFSYEIDLWKRFARATEAAIADLAVTEAGYRHITISLVAEVATTYFLLLDLDARYEIAEQTTRGREDSLSIIKSRFDAGIVPELDVNQAEIQLAVATATTAELERRVLQTENAMRVLLGAFPGSIERGKSLANWEVGDSIPAGLPSELLQRRPDLIAAERNLAAETARIGVAEALRWPSISLTAMFGVVNPDLSNLNASSQQIWDVGLGIFAPVFRAGQLKASAQAQRIRAERALLLYEGAVRQAFREVEDALIARRTLQKELAARSQQVVAGRNAVRLSRARYDSEIVSYLEVLDAERTLFDAELKESATRRATIVATIDLYKSLGGGWIN